MIDGAGSILHTHWLELRQGRAIPARTEINPRRFVPALEHLLLLEQRRSEPARIRIGGLRVCEMAGGEVRGMPARALFAKDEQSRAEHLFDAAFDGPCEAEALCSAQGANGVVYRATMTLRPLADATGASTRLFGTINIDFDGTLHAPVRLTLLETDIRAIAVAEARETRRAVAGERRLISVDGGNGGTSPARRGHLSVVR